MRLWQLASQPSRKAQSAAHPAIPWMLVVLALVVAVVGWTFASSDETGTFGSVVSVPANRPNRESPKGTTLAQRLDTIRREVEIRPEQDAAWRRFVGSMVELDALTRRFEQRAASGLTLDETTERARHAMLYGTSMNDIEADLSPKQAAIFRRISGRLATTAVCRKLAGR